MAVGDVLQLRIVGRYQSQNIVNTLHYRIITQSVDEQSICQNLCARWETACKSNWLAAHVDDYTLVGTKCFGIGGASKTPGFDAIGDAGTVVATGLPAFVCRTITLYTASTNHRRRGRVMLSGSPTTHVNESDGAVNATGLSLLDAIGGDLDGEIGDSNDDFHAGLPALVGGSFDNFNDFKSRPTPSAVTSRRIRQFLIG